MSAADALALKRALSDAQGLAAALGLKPKRSNGRAKVLVSCPWHLENEPSCSLSPGDDGTLRVRCFGCGVTGDALTLIAAVKGLDMKREFPRVLSEAAHIAGLRLDEPELSAPTPAEPRPATQADGRAREGLRAIGRVILHLGRLDDSPIAAAVCAYLARRGLLEEARRESLAALPAASVQPAWARLFREALEGELVEASGMLRRDGFAFPDHRLVIPWRAPGGELDTLQRRTLGGDGEPRYVFPAGLGPRFPFGVEALTSAASDAPIAFVEGALDVLAARTLYRRKGVARIALGLPGASGWHHDWAELGRGREVFLGFDNDDAGERAVGPIADELERAGAARVLRARPVGGKDWGALVEASR